MFGFVVLCLFGANFVHIFAVPLPQYVYPPAIVCVPCCAPCDVVVGDNNAAYYVGEVYPYYSNDVQPIADYPIAYGTDPFYQPMVDTVQPVEPPSDTGSLPVGENAAPVPTNVLDDPMETLIRSALSELAEKHGDSEKHFTDAVQNYLNRMADNKTT